MIHENQPQQTNQPSSTLDTGSCGETLEAPEPMASKKTRDLEPKLPGKHVFLGGGRGGKKGNHDYVKQKFNEIAGTGLAS